MQACHTELQAAVRSSSIKASFPLFLETSLNIAVQFNHLLDSQVTALKSSLKGNSYWLKRCKWRTTTTLVNTLRMPKSDHPCKQANMLAAFPLTIAKYKRWWSHCHFLGLPDISASYFARQLKKGAVDFAIHTSGFDCNWLKAIIVKLIIFLAFVCCCTAWFYGADYIVVA